MTELESRWAVIWSLSNITDTYLLAGWTFLLLWHTGDSGTGNILLYMLFSTFLSSDYFRQQRLRDAERELKGRNPLEDKAELARSVHLSKSETIWSCINVGSLCPPSQRKVLSQNMQQCLHSDFVLTSWEEVAPGRRGTRSILLRRLEVMLGTKYVLSQYRKPFCPQKLRHNPNPLVSRTNVL